MQKALLLMAVLSLTGGAASAKERAGRKTGAALHRLAKGADRLEVVRVSAPLCTEPMIRVTDAKEIEEFLRLFDGLSKANWTHACAGHPVTRLYRGEDLVAEFSVDHGYIIRSLGTAMESYRDSPMPMEMAKQVADWYARHGLAAYQIEVEKKFSMYSGVERAIAILPPKTRKHLSARPKDNDEDFSEGLAVFTKEVPDPKQQASILLRSLAQLSTREQHSYVSLPLGRIGGAVPHEAILSVLNEATSGSDELLGALRLEGRLVEQLLAEGSARLPALRERIAQRVALDPVSERSLDFIQRMSRIRDLSPQTQDYLSQAVTRWARQVCFSDSIYSAFRDGWLKAAVEKRLPGWFARALQEAAWSCPPDAAEARVIVGISRGKLPDSQDLICVGALTLLHVCEFAQQRGSTEDINFALAHLVQDWRAVRRILRWLGPLSGLSKEQSEAAFRSSKEDRLLVKHLQTWWKTARASYRPPVPAAPSAP